MTQRPHDGSVKELFQIVERLAVGLLGVAGQAITLLALAVAVPTVVVTLPAGQDASDGNGGGANFSAPADEAQTERAEPPTTDPGTRWLPALRDCVESLPG